MQHKQISNNKFTAITAKNFNAIVHSEMLSNFLIVYIYLIYWAKLLTAICSLREDAELRSLYTFAMYVKKGTVSVLISSKRMFENDAENHSLRKDTVYT